VDAPLFDLRKQLLQLAVTNQRIAADEGDVEGRFVLVEQGKDARDELVCRGSRRVGAAPCAAPGVPRRTRSIPDTERDIPW